MRTSLHLGLCSCLLVLAGCDGGNVMPGTDSGVPRGDAGPPIDTGVPPTDSGLPPVDGGPVGPGTRPTGPYVDPSCTDGTYSEVLPDSTISIADLTAAYAPGDVQGFIDRVLERRYATGLQLVMEGSASPFVTPGGSCATLFLGDTSSATAVIQQLDTAVHECGHMADGERSSSPENVYVVTTSLVLTARQGDTTSRGGLTFARSRIVNDSYQTLRMPCGGTFGPDCDNYADTYLDGDPDDGTFEGGDQGFNLLFDELVQYVNSLATGYAFSDVFMTGGRRLLTFLWYTERYLRMARLDFPTAYAHLLDGDAGRWRRAVLTIWGRAWLYLEQTEALTSLGINDDVLESYVTDPDLLEEIERLRMAEGC
jgi:hypothetical protein